MFHRLIDRWRQSIVLHDNNNHNDNSNIGDGPAVPAHGRDVEHPVAELDEGPALDRDVHRRQLLQ